MSEYLVVVCHCFLGAVSWLVYLLNIHQLSRLWRKCFKYAEVQPSKAPNYTDGEIVECVTPSALRKQNESVIIGGVLDILTDTMSK